MNDTLLHQIQMEAVDGDYDLASLLRNCRVLAQRLNNSDLKQWVVNELDGYGTEAELPSYRVLSQALLLGHYFGAFGAEVRNVQIPTSAVLEEFREHVVGVRFTQGVREIQEQIANSEKGALRIAVPPEAHAAIQNTQIREDMVLGSVIKIVSTSFLQGILDTVRNRILNFTLELESEAPKTGDPLESLRMNKSDKVQQIFNTEIKGGVSNLAQGSSGFTQRIEVPRGDVESLKRSSSINWFGQGIGWRLRGSGARGKAVEEGQSRPTCVGLNGQNVCQGITRTPEDLRLGGRRCLNPDA